MIIMKYIKNVMMIYLMIYLTDLTMSLSKDQQIRLGLLGIFSEIRNNFQYIV